MKSKIPRSLTLGQAQVNAPVQHRGIEKQWAYKVAAAYFMGNEMTKLMEQKYFDIHKLFK